MIGKHPRTVQRAWQDAGLPKIGKDHLTDEEREERERQGKTAVSVSGDRATISTDNAPDLGDADTLLRSRGLSPDDWAVERVKVNEWDGADGSTKRQLTAHLKHRRSIVSVRQGQPLPRSYKPVTVSRKRPFLAAWFFDHHAPYHSQPMHRAILAWLRQNQPGMVGFGGDIPDFPDVSRWPDKEAFNAQANECIDASTQILYDYRSAAPDAEMHYLAGNHGDRIRRELFGRAERTAQVRPGRFPGEETEQDVMHSLRRILRMDELGIEYHRTPGEYQHTKFELAPALGIVHGHLHGKNALEKMLDTYGHSVVFGHLHYRAMLTKSRYSMGRRESLVSVCAGTCAELEGGLGHSVNPNWQNGFVTATIWPDGNFNLEFASFENGVLSWRDQRISA